MGEGGGGGGQVTGLWSPTVFIMQLKYQPMQSVRSLWTDAGELEPVEGTHGHEFRKVQQQQQQQRCCTNLSAYCRVFAQEEAGNPVITHYAKNISFCTMKIPRLCLTIPTTVKRASVSKCWHEGYRLSLYMFIFVF